METTTSTAIANAANGGYWLNGMWVPWNWETTGYPQTNVTYYYPQQYCQGETHVFGCEHAEKCKCGIASRKVEPKRCGSCGKKL